MKIKENTAFLYIVIIFISSLIISNIIAVKPIIVGNLIFPSGIIVFPITYIIGDILAEIYGFEKTKKVILLGFLANLLVVSIIYISILLPPAPFWEDQQAYESIFSLSPRLLLASFLGYLIGSLSNAKIFVKIKEKTEDNHLWIRTIGSTIVGEGLDSIFFVFIAFLFIFPIDILFAMIINQWLFKTTYEILATPITYIVIKKIKNKIG